MPRRRDAIALMGPESQPAATCPSSTDFTQQRGGPDADQGIIIILSVPTFTKLVKRRKIIFHFLPRARIVVELGSNMLKDPTDFKTFETSCRYKFVKKIILLKFEKNVHRSQNILFSGHLAL